MSRSYRKHLWIKDGSNRNRTLPKHLKSKTQANHRVRQVTKQEIIRLGKTADWDNMLPNQHNDYRRIYDSWDISDFKFIYRPSDSPLSVPYWKWLNK